jgi:hypothetical protein
MSSTADEIPVTVLLQERLRATSMVSALDHRLDGKRLVARFEKGYCLLLEPGQDQAKAMWVRPKSFLRSDSHTMIVDTGTGNFGRLVLSFDSSDDTDGAVDQMKKLMSNG